jgi:hypothetical protein
MDENDRNIEKVPILIVERRRQRQELSSADVMRILKKRAAKAERKASGINLIDVDAIE